LHFGEIGKADLCSMDKDLNQLFDTRWALKERVPLQQFFVPN
jgi:hypothetical protein